MPNLLKAIASSVCIGSVLCGAAPSAPVANTSAVEALKAGIERGLADLDDAVAHRPLTVSTSALSNGALAKLVLHNNRADASTFIDRFLTAQKPDGSFSWLLNSAAVNDDNATAFATQAIGPILLRYGNRLNPAVRARLEIGARMAILALERRTVPTDYTNIYLMQATDVLLMGEAVGDRDAEQYSIDHFDAWIARVRSVGIHEFDSGTYYQIAIQEISVAAAMTTSTSARERLRRILNYYWADIAAHMVGRRFGGARSRDYDFVGRYTNLLQQIALAGLATPTPGWTQTPDEVLSLLGADELARLPAAVADLLDRSGIVEGTYGALADQTWYSYIGKGIELSSAGADYGDHDKLINVTFAADVGAGMAVIPEGAADPYGVRKTLIPGLGESRSIHLPLHPTMIQRGPILVAILDLDPEGTTEGLPLTTSLLLPLRASVRVNGSSVNLLRDAAYELSTRDIISVQAGESTAFVRIAYALNGDQQNESMRLISDEAGRAVGAARVVIAFDRPSRASSKHNRFVMFIGVTDSADGELAHQFKMANVQSSVNKTWHVAAMIGQMRFEAEVDGVTRKALSRTVNGLPLKRPEPLVAYGKQIYL